ncbi:gamma-glutamylcyclotransferase [Mucilaginibacter calamicampi]|uniref:Gamma-glutamylcyclotransferase n=1 Tax=Mucilaginibacter calamicampi TaxID=1302352 RepID=A0ABW2YRZ1_9SPHI
MNNNLLFVYGSLLDGNNEFGRYLLHNADFVDIAIFKGRLYNCGEYPGAIADDAGYDIKGRIYCLNNPANDFDILDDYEGFGAEQIQPNLFIRQLETVTIESKSIECWIYLYNLPVNGLTEIITGDYSAYLKA